mmetsp:Transcript_14243/g.21728  ORF Transcript_14243/g.21728 Transcript_14243/m.21728 type:complete len:230 (-) Transcript_14243:184-873(-)
MLRTKTKASSVIRGNVLRVVLTGGPCSGKSSALSYLQKNVPGPIYCLPEVATLMNNSGLKFCPDVSYDQYLSHQLAICQLQLALEDNMTQVASSRHEDTSILLCDRGIIDNKGYMTSEQWTDVLKTMDQTEASLLNNYAGVIHMDTAAKGALEFYKSGDTVDDSGNKVSRSESSIEAVALDDVMWNVWQNHPYQFRVVNNNNNKTKDPFQAKLKETMRALEAIRSKSSE